MNRRLLIAIATAFTVASPIAFAAPVVIYDSGPTVGTDASGAHSIQSGAFVLSEAFTAGADAAASALRIGLWMDSGVTLSHIAWSIGSAFFGSDVASGLASSFTTSLLKTIDSRYDISDELFSIGSVDLSAGATYYLSLTATTSDASNPFWDTVDQASGASRLRRVSDGAVFAEAHHSLTVFGDTAAAVDEPATLALASLALLAGLGAVRRVPRNACPGSARRNALRPGA